MVVKLLQIKTLSVNAHFVSPGRPLQKSPSCARFVWIAQVISLFQTTKLQQRSPVGELQQNSPIEPVRSSRRGSESSRHADARSPPPSSTPRCGRDSSIRTPRRTDDAVRRESCGNPPGARSRLEESTRFRQIGPPVLAVWLCRRSCQRPRDRPWRRFARVFEPRLPRRAGCPGRSMRRSRLDRPSPRRRRDGPSHRRFAPASHRRHRTKPSRPEPCTRRSP